MLSSKTNALLTHTLASFWRKQSYLSIFLPEPWRQPHSQLSLRERKSGDWECSAVVGWDAFWACGRRPWPSGLYKPATVAGGEHNLWMPIWIHLWANYTTWVQTQPFPAKAWRKNGAIMRGRTGQSVSRIVDKLVPNLAALSPVFCWMHQWRVNLVSYKTIRGD